MTRVAEDPAADASRSRWTVALPLLVVVGVTALLVVVTREPASEPAMSGPAGSGSATAEGPPAVEVASDAPRFASLEELAAASDAVVRAEVVATERGRWFGDGAGGTRIQSRLVTLRVTEVMAGVAPSSATLLLEEEGWLEDGAPLVVDGAAPSQVGDDGIWFVLDGTDPEVGAYVIVNAQGRYLIAGDGRTLSGAAGDDPLVARLTAMTVDELTADLRAVRHPARRGRDVPGGS
ncbi:hypothetical protein [Iamia sp.]|uniref:hypothetical protein n=1 Tax=Iamia sp. TaxID=2722710 RepID=UPI002CB9C9ED|nr:hypothetical protein [Iamia sp.]HXH57593.1 hypothetical protein [Iamia sp.]